MSGGPLYTYLQRGPGTYTSRGEASDRWTTGEKGSDRNPRGRRLNNEKVLDRNTTGFRWRAKLTSKDSDLERDDGELDDECYWKS